MLFFTYNVAAYVGECYVSRKGENLSPQANIHENINYAHALYSVIALKLSLHFKIDG